jgi:hypothetical protein
MGQSRLPCRCLPQAVQIAVVDDGRPGPASTLDDPVGEALHVPDLDLRAEVPDVFEQLELRLEHLGQIPSKSRQ